MAQNRQTIFEIYLRFDCSKSERYTSPKSRVLRPSRKTQKIVFHSKKQRSDNFAIPKNADVYLCVDTSNDGGAGKNFEFYCGKVDVSLFKNAKLSRYDVYRWHPLSWVTVDVSRAGTDRWSASALIRYDPRSQYYDAENDGWNLDESTSWISDVI